MVSQLTAPGTPPQNRVAEQRNGTLLDIVRSMMSYSTLPNSFWGYVLQTIADILNIVPSKAIQKHPWNYGMAVNRVCDTIEYGVVQHTCLIEVKLGN